MKLPWEGLRVGLGDYVPAFAAVGVATPLQLFVSSLAGFSLPFLSYLVAVLLVAWRGGLGPGLVTTTASALAASYFFVPQSYSWTIGSGGLFAVIFFLVQGVLISALCEGRLRTELVLGSTVARLTEERDARIKLLESERTAREDAERARREAEEANRAKDDFLAVLSHELRTPLNPVIGWTQMLRSGRVPPEKQAEVLEVIERNARLQNNLIEDMLDVSRIVRGELRCELRPIAPAGPVLQAIEAVGSAVQEKGVRLVVSVDKECPRVLADPVRLQQVVWNLLANAVKFTPAGGQVEAQLEHRDFAIQLIVRDSGAGIRPDMLPHLFEAFRQGDSGSTRRSGGLGLGLFIVRYLVEVHGGSVNGESEGEGKGATFTVELPTTASLGQPSG